MTLVRSTSPRARVLTAAASVVTFGLGGVAALFLFVALTLAESGKGIDLSPEVAGVVCGAMVGAFAAAPWFFLTRRWQVFAWVVPPLAVLGAAASIFAFP